MTRRASINSFTAPMTAAPPKDNADARNRLIDEDIKVKSRVEYIHKGNHSMFPDSQKENAQRREERKREVRGAPLAWVHRN